MEFLIIILVAFGASMLTFFSGFGLGTILTPAFILFFPAEMAVAATAIVHFLNNLFKLSLVGRNASLDVVIKFGIPSILGAFGGALLLSKLSVMDMERTLSIVPGVSTTILNFVIGVTIIIFSLLEIVPALRSMQFSSRWLFPGGVVSGFFGGLSGHQGALRSAFLIKLGLSKQAFIASGVVIACCVDVVRLGTYSIAFDWNAVSEHWMLLVFATASAFGGAYLGKRLLKTMTLDALQIIVGVMMMSIGVLLAIGVV